MRSYTRSKLVTRWIPFSVRTADRLKLYGKVLFATSRESVATDSELSATERLRSLRSNKPVLLFVHQWSKMGGASALMEGMAVRMTQLQTWQKPLDSDTSHSEEEEECDLWQTATRRKHASVSDSDSGKHLLATKRQKHKGKHESHIASAAADSVDTASVYFDTEEQKKSVDKVVKSEEKFADAMESSKKIVDKKSSAKAVQWPTDSQSMADGILEDDCSSESEGYICVVFDQRGVGRSEGRCTLTCLDEVKDCEAVAKWLVTAMPQSAASGLCVIGSSAGAPSAGSIVPLVDAVTSYVAIGYPFGWLASVLFSLHFCTILESVKPKLFIQGSADGFTSVSTLKSKVATAKGPVNDIVVVDGLGHFELETAIYDEFICNEIHKFLTKLKTVAL